MSASDDHRPAAARRRLRLRKPTWRGWFTIALVAVIAALLTAWAIDYGTLGDRVARNVTVETVGVGRLSGDALEAALEQADAEYGTGVVEFVVDGTTHTRSAADIGLHLDTEATMSSARRVARSDPAPLRPIYWLASWFRPRPVPITIELDRARLTEALAELPGQTPVTEPRVVGSVDAVGTSPGAVGYGFDPDRVASQLEREARDGTLPLRVPLVAETIEPVVSDAEIAKLAERAQELTDRDLVLTIPGAAMTATPPMLRSWVTSELPAGARTARLAMRTDAVVAAARSQLGRPVSDPVPATFTVEDSQVLLVPQVDGRECCDTGSGAAVLAALEDGAPAADLPLAPVDPDFTTEDARALGITTLLGADLGPQTQVLWSPDPPPDASTTTTTVPEPEPEPDLDAPGQFTVPIPDRRGQVANVDRALPMLRGRIIEPGGSLSLNAVIGAPSPDRGFVAADVATVDGPTWISGGGTDLIAAALFEAAFESGLDIEASTRHGVLPDGVRPGIEATLGWTQPDLVVANPSAHGVLVWADRVGGVVRIQLFGTPFTRSISSTTNEARYGPRNACLEATVERTRVFDDGLERVDTFTGRYGPSPRGRDDPARVVCSR